MKIKIIKTFIQGACSAFFTAMGAVVFTDMESMKAGVLGAVFAGLATGICAVMNIPAVAAWFNYYGEKSEEEE